METVCDLMRKRADGIKATVKELFTKHTRVEPIRDDPNDCVFVLHLGSHYWGELSPEGRRLASKAREEYERLHEVLRVLLRAQPAYVIKELKHDTERLMDWIDHSGEHSFKCGDAAFAEFCKDIDAQVGLLEHLYDDHEGQVVLVPDTCSLLENPALESWSFAGMERFTLVLTPTVVSELDQHRLNYRVQEVRDKAKKLGGQLREYQRRGSLCDGVPLVRDKITLRAVAIEPDMEQSFSWLDPKNHDDRILAGFVEVMRQHPRCRVALVTSDANLRIKAEYAGVPFVDTPEPVSAAVA